MCFEVLWLLMVWYGDVKVKSNVMFCVLCVIDVVGCVVLLIGDIEVL